MISIYRYILIIISAAIMTCTTVMTGAYGQQCDKSILDAVNKAISDRDSVVTGVTKCEKASPSQQFVAKYNPKAVYCARCEYDMKPRPYAGFKGIKSVIVIVNQSGSISLIYSGQNLLLPEMREIWDSNCPFPFEAN
jgi:hypothetical protein